MAERPRALTGFPAGRTDRVGRLRQQVDDLRDEIGRDVYELESRFRATFDPRRQIEKHPFVAAAIVVSGVIVVARLAAWLLLGSGRRSRGRGSRCARRKEGR